MIMIMIVIIWFYLNVTENLVGSWHEEWLMSGVSVITHLTSDTADQNSGMCQIIKLILIVMDVMGVGGGGCI